MPTSALFQEHLIPALRNHTVTTIDLGALRGLVCAPSFHTAAGVLYIVTAWPIARLRWTLVPINLAMLLATPVEGTHYLIDMIAGLIVAVAAYAAVELGLHVLDIARARRMPDLAFDA
jgi:membrane-associated phospholipid phosphatase